MHSLVRILFLAAVSIGLGTASIAAQQPPPLTTTTISGGDLPHPLQLAAPDHEAFMRRLDLPPLLDDEPELRGKSYTLTSPYWDVGVRAGDNTQFLVEEAATYYPEGGYVKTDQNGETVWTALDSTQRAIVDRYIRYASVLPEQPSVFDVLRAAGLANEPVGVSIGAVELTPEQRTKFWDASRDLTVTSIPPSSSHPEIDFRQIAPTDAWVISALPSGRSISMLYSSATGTLVEPTEWQIRPNENRKMIAVPQDWLMPVLGSQANPASGDLAPLSIPQEEGHGSPVWWLIMLGGGAGAIVAAVLLHKQLAKAPLRGHDAERQLEP